MEDGRDRTRMIVACKEHMSDGRGREKWATGFPVRSSRLLRVPRGKLSALPQAHNPQRYTRQNGS